MLLRNRPLLIGLLVLFALLEARLAADLVAAGFDWRPLWGAPIVRGTMVDFTFTVAWAALYLLDAGRRQGRSGWAWMPLLLIFPTLALFLFTLTEREPRERAGEPGAEPT
jgi:hypothetical protein